MLPSPVRPRIRHGLAASGENTNFDWRTCYDRGRSCAMAVVGPSGSRFAGRRARQDEVLWDNGGNSESPSLPGGHLISVDNKPFFFQHYGLTGRDLERYLGAALSAGGDYADLYFEYLSSTSLSVDESMVKSASQGISAGCGIRVVSGERTGYAYSDDLSASRILHAARTAALIASAPAKTPVAGFEKTAARSLYPV